MAKVLEYKSLLSGWKLLQPMYAEANDNQWLEWARRNYSEVRVRYADGKVVK